MRAQARRRASMREVPRSIAWHECGHYLVDKADGCTRWGLRRDPGGVWRVQVSPSNDAIGLGDVLARRFLSGACAELMSRRRPCRTISDLYCAPGAATHDLRVLRLLRDELGDRRVERNLVIVRSRLMLADLEAEAAKLQVAMGGMAVGETRTFWTRAGGEIVGIGRR